MMYKVGEEKTKFDAQITKFDCRVRHVAVSPDNQWVAAAGEWVSRLSHPFKIQMTDPYSDGSIRVVPVSNVTQMRSIDAHIGSARSLAFDPLSKYLASAGTDGMLKIWSVQEKFNKVIFPPEFSKKFLELYIDSVQVGQLAQIIPKGEPEFKDNIYLSRMSWHPDTIYLAVPSNEGGNFLGIFRGSRAYNICTCHV